MKEEGLQGEFVQTLVRIRPSQEGRQNLKSVGKNLCVMDNNKRVVEEVSGNSVFGAEMPLQEIYDSQVFQYIGPLLQGFNVSLFAWGQQQSGKSYVLFENKREKGLGHQLIESLFKLLKAKQKGRGEYEYEVRLRCVEIEEEEAKDLLRENEMQGHVGVVDDEWEGVRLEDVTWRKADDHHLASQWLQEAQLRRRSFSSSAACLFTIEVVQNLQLERKARLVLVSRLSLLDLPSDEVLLDSMEATRVQDGSTTHKAIFSVANLMQALFKGTPSPVLHYENSLLTKLIKDTLGGNCLSLGLFCLAQGDYQKNLNTLSYYKMAGRIVNYPIVNDSKALGLLRRMRAESIFHSAKDQNIGRNVNQVEMEKKLIEHNLESLKLSEEKQALSGKIGELRNQYNTLVQQKNQYQNELIKSEQEKLEVSKALVDLQMENTKLMEVLQNEKYELHTKIMNQEGDILQQNIKEEQALKQAAVLQEELDNLKADRKDMEIEFIALKKNYLRVRSDLEQEKDKNQSLGLELINSVNKNKALSEEMNEVFQQTGQAGEEKDRYSKQVARLESENREYKEAMVMSRAQVEKLKTQLMKYDLLDKQNQLEMEQRTVQMERQHLEQGKQDAQDRKTWQQESTQQQQNIKQQQTIWESQKMALVQQLKTAHRKAQQQQNSIEVLTKEAQQQQQELHKAQVEMDQMRQVYRQKLQQFMELSSQEEQQVNLSIKSKHELLRTYSAKEQEMAAKVASMQSEAQGMKQQVSALQAYSRQLRALAEDWAPLGEELPDILKQGEDALLSEGPVQDQIAKLTRENTALKKQQNLIVSSNPKIELQQMASRQHTEETNKKTLQMQEENSRLVKMLKDNKKWDIYLLQKENNRLMETVKILEKKESISPVSGDPENLRQKLIYFDRIVRQLEQERSELIVRATMAEEQLKSMTELAQRNTRSHRTTPLSQNKPTFLQI